MLSLTKGSETLIKVPLIKVNNGDGILKLYNLLFSAVVFNFRSTAEVELSRAEILKGETDRQRAPPGRSHQECCIPSQISSFKCNALRVLNLMFVVK